MLFLRIVAILIGLGAAVCAAAWVFTGDRAWLGRSFLLLKVGVAVGLVFFGVLLLERVVA